MQIIGVSMKIFFQIMKIFFLLFGIGIFVIGNYIGIEEVKNLIFDWVLRPQGTEQFAQGIAFSKKGQYDRSITFFNEALKINPRYVEAYINRGICYNNLEQYDNACSDWMRACELGLCKNYELAKRNGDCK